MSEKKDDAREAHDALFERPFRDGPTDEVRDTFDKPTEEQALADWSVALDRSVPVTEENFLVRMKAAVDIAQDLARDAHHERQVAAETVGIVRELVSHAGLITLADQRVREMHSELVDMRRTNQDLLSVVYALGARVEQMGQALGLPEPAKRVPWYPKPIQAGYEGSGDKRTDEIRAEVDRIKKLAEPQEAELVEVLDAVQVDSAGEMGAHSGGDESARR